MCADLTRQTDAAMAQWYYSDEERNRHGPLDAAAMAALHDRGELGPDTLVWRDGLDQWRPWRELAAELIATPGFAPLADPEQAEQASAGRTAAAVAAAQAEAEARRSPADAGLAAAAGTGLPGDATAQAAAAAATSDTPTADAPGADSPYAAPRAAVAENSQVVLGQPVTAAGFWRRFAAYLIDSTLVGTLYYAVATVLFIGVFMVGIAGDSGRWLEGGATLSAVVTAISTLSYVLISACYYAGMESSSSMQATLGKLAVGIKVVDADGARLGRGRALARWAASIASWLTLGVGFLMAAFTERKRGLHDLLARTQVVDRWAYTARPELQRDELGVVTWVVLVLGGLIWLGVIGFIVGALVFGLR
ncbi:RDD family protein [Lysobacter enzymogenes]|uniref:RDD family protein n=1 Tax=Lysobacter enzymogenes TaxID=69 RepID=UPI001304336F|nr:RDD family protein [Lysobacter enzymogenes]UZW60299.1 RDD family protein [Lysobacter enzymogenes]